MNRFLKLTCIALAAIIVMGSTAAPAATPPAPAQENVAGNRAILNFIWFYDWFLTDPTGTACDINLELNRLRALHPGYTFSAYFSMSLHPFEFGYYPFYPLQIIYSDL